MLHSIKRIASENSYIFASAMQAYSFRINYLLMPACLFSLGLKAQTGYSKVAGSDLTPDTIRSSLSRVHHGGKVDELIRFAKRFLGTPYRYAGSTPSGFDCSGFISYIFGNFGLSLIHSSYGMAELGKTVRLSEIRPGDLLFFKGSDIHSDKIGHVALVTEVSEHVIHFIHSSSSRGVVIENLKNSKYFIPRFIKAKRLDYGEQ